MDWDSWSDLDKSIFKASKNWFHWHYYLLPVFPLLVGTFLGANGSELRFFPLILLCFVIFFGKTAISAFALLREKQGLPVSERKYLFEKAKLPFEETTLRFFAFVASAFALFFGFILCIISGFGLLTFGILTMAITFCYFLGYPDRHYGIDMILGFFGTFFLTAAAYYTQLGAFHWSALAVSLPLGFITAALLLLCEDISLFEDDKKTVHGAFGNETAKRLTFLLFVAAYGFIILNVLYGVSGFWCLLLLLLLPLAKKAFLSETAFFSFYLKFGLLYGFCMLLGFTF